MKGVERISKNKKGLSTIVATLLILLLIFVAVGIIWVVVRNVIQEGSEQISLGKFTLDLKISKVQITDDSTIRVKVKRNPGAGDFIALNFIVSDGDDSEVIRIDDSLLELEETSYNLLLENLNASNLETLQVAPIFLLESGKEVVGPIKDEYKYGTSITTSCSQTCDSLGWECDSVCGESCGTCGTEDVCSGGYCVEQSSCTDTCTSLGFSCGSHSVCGTITTCGGCSGISLFCDTNSCSNCLTGSADCNELDLDGCEVSLLTDSNNCGSCNNVCGTGEVCSEGDCITSTQQTVSWETDLISWWKLDGNADDSVGNNDGTLSGVTSVSSDCISGTCYSFDGSNDYIDIGEVNPVGSDSLSVSAWIKPTYTADGFQGIVMHGGPNIDTFAFYSLPYADSFGFKTSGTTGEWMEVDFPSDFYDGNWHFVTATYSGSTMGIYYDGSLLDSISSSGDMDSGSDYRLLIGAGRDTEPPTGFYSGIMDEVMIWDRALSSSEIFDLYDSFNYASGENNCVTHSYFQCYNGDVYWYNSCEVREELKEDCSSSETCQSGTCVEEEETNFLRTFYVSPSGSDSNDGRSESTPWRTLSKVNGQSFLPGDGILFERGGTWQGTLTISSSGNSNNYLTFGAYGTGDKPKITGLTTLSGWISQGGGIYSTTVNCQSELNMLILDGENTARGRYPNENYLTYESYSGTNLIIDNQLSSSPDWTGAEVVIRKNRWVLDRNVVTNHDGNYIYYTPVGDSAVSPYLKGYFFQDDIKTLDLFGEWFYDDGTLYVYFGSENPSSHEVSVASVDTLFDAPDRDYVIIDGLHFEGANKYAINFPYNSNNIIVKNSKIEFTGGIAINTYNINNFIANNNYFDNSNDIAIYIEGDSSEVVLTNNIFKNTGTLPGAFSTWGARGVFLAAEKVFVQYNEFINTGYTGLRLDGDDVLVKNNFFDTFCTVIDDCGGIYTTGIRENVSISENILINGLGNSQGALYDILLAQGIYLDEPSSGMSVTKNTVAYCTQGGITLHEAQYIDIEDNVFFSNKNQINYLGSGSQPSYPLNYNNVQRNFLVPETSDQNVLHYRVSSSGDDAGFHPGVSDYNYYFWSNENDLRFSMGNDLRSFDYWKSITNQDSHTSQRYINPDDILFEYNPTKQTKTISLSGTYTGMDGTSYSGSVNIAPYRSIILIKD